MGIRTLPTVAAVGDAICILLFAALGRNAHHEHAGLSHVIGTALPFLAGWYVAAILLGAYAFATITFLPRLVRRVIAAALLGGAIGLTVRSLLEGRIVPVSFMIVALTFLTGILTVWRLGLRLLVTRYRATG